jgi:transposase-like protein
MATRPKCAHRLILKSAKVGDTQRWLFRGCGYQSTRTTPHGRPRWQKSPSVSLYCHGTSTHAPGKMFGVRAGSALKWLRRYTGGHAAKPEPTGHAIGLGLDERWHCLPKNGGSSGSGRLVLPVQAGARTESVGVVMRPP